MIIYEKCFKKRHWEAICRRGSKMRTFLSVTLDRKVEMTDMERVIYQPTSEDDLFNPGILGLYHKKFRRSLNHKFLLILCAFLV